MLNPSRRIVATIAVVALMSLVLGLATDVGPFGWSLAALLGLYVMIAAVAQRRRPA
jgi:peptidoglycan/LPS O-acetylase OafA/YrhL